MQRWNGWRRSVAACAVMALSLPASMAWAQDEEGAAAALTERVEGVEEKADAIASRLTALEAAAAADELAALRAELEDLKGKVTLVSPLASQIQNLEKRLGDLEAMAEPGAASGDNPYPFDIVLSGYIRAVQTTIIEGDDNQLAFVGLNDGWGLSSARLSLDGTFRDLAFRLQFDGALQRFEEGNAPDGEVRTEAKDAWMEYRPFREFQIRAGRFKNPLIAEELGATASQLFIENSVGVRGVQSVEGRNVVGLAQGRQYGIMYHGESVFDPEGEKRGEDTLGIHWYVATTNGNNANEPLNDNDDFASMSRVELFYRNAEREKFKLGLGGFINNKTTGLAPDLIDEEEAGGAADLWFNWPVGDSIDLILEAQAVFVSRSFPDLEVEPKTTALAWHAAPGVRVQEIGLAFLYRYAFFDPTLDSESDDPVLQQQDDTDALTYHTIGLDWMVPGYPLRLQMNYTITVEDDQQAVDNDVFQMLGQVTF